MRNLTRESGSRGAQLKTGPGIPDTATRPPEVQPVYRMGDRAVHENDVSKAGDPPDGQPERHPVLYLMTPVPTRSSGAPALIFRPADWSASAGSDVHGDHVSWMPFILLAGHRRPSVRHRRVPEATVTVKAPSTSTAGTRRRAPAGITSQDLVALRGIKPR